MKAARAWGNAWRRERGYAEMPDMDTQAYGDHLTPLVLVALNTGLRRGELFNLRWSDVHMDKRLLTGRGATAKTGQTRHVPLNREAVAVLTAWRAQSPADGYVFPGRDGTGRLDNVRKAWTALLREAKIEGFRFHDLRHHFASKLVMAGTPLYTVQRLLGHHSPLMTAKYAHLSPDHQAAAVERLCTPVTMPGRSISHG
jgi:integrase